ncbi:Xaa-Pro aminopeptidase [Thioalkalivibrio nitratireducens DSM 14787]|uniref:Xaa-Pro aminopeptidase n=1 Tax=Thioalkalivibrio nitratireducens (strain DSM 14787 / UNIQEM 213 / ALEN2) TaxID=1255043 RepID=L0DUS6_THIND|nr:Xaa-Pro aminopeptidase [Thioalkalivibrio nitratireducens]AGA32745.1 Xaa-Pro aminopeptidase [Thioalkalivibrio nitratireducens DSM 14787]
MKTPQIPSKDFVRRRQRLMRALGDQAIAVIPAATERLRNRDVEYAFRQDSDFLYLTGFPEPEAIAVLVPGREAGEYVLFCRDRDPDMETWNGRRAGPDGAVSGYGADCAFPIGDVDEILPGLMENRITLCAPFGHSEALDQRLFGWVNQVRAKVRAGVRAPREFVALEHHLHEQRLFKQASEIRMMRHAADISSGAHVRAMQACRPGMAEYEVEAELLHEFRRHGAEPAYHSIVGGGENGCILHYVENRSTLRDGNLLLIDAGCEYQGYASDITRTFPVSGQFTSAQREVYELVLEAQAAAIAKAVPGNHWNDPHDAAVGVLTRGLKALGVLKGRPADLIRKEAYKPYYMHRTGHWLGLDVHDVGDYRIGEAWRLLEPGMVLTVEPGLYFGPRASAPKRFRGIGIRIEDDVAITRSGHEVLSADCPKTVAAVEACCAAAPAAAGPGMR